MKKFRKMICVALLFALLLPATPVHAITWSYKQIIDFVESIKIDGNKIFSNRTDFIMERDPDPDEFFCMKGAVLMWFGDTEKGQLWLFNRDNIRQGCIWQSVDRRYFNVIMPVLMTFMKDYIDFDHGGKLTFMITTDAAFTKPFAQLVYTTKKNASADEYSNSDKFCEDVKLLAESIIIGN